MLPYVCVNKQSKEYTRKHQAIQRLICIPIMKHVPICLSVPCSYWCVGSRCAPRHSCSTRVSMRAREREREKHLCCSIGSESPSDYMDLGINKRFVQSGPTSALFPSGTAWQTPPKRRVGSHCYHTLECRHIWENTARSFSWHLAPFHVWGIEGVSWNWWGFVSVLYSQNGFFYISLHYNSL